MTKPAFTYWTTDKDTRHETRWRRCTTCGNKEAAPSIGFTGRHPCRYCPGKGPRNYTGGTPST